MARAGSLDRIVGVFESAAGAFLAVVTALTFVSVVLRYAFNWGIPDAFDISRNLLGIVIFWGIGVAGHRGDHITVDLLWGAFGPRLRRAIDIFASILSLGGIAVFAWMMADKVLTTRADNVLTFDLHIPVWPFFLVAWIGLVLAVLLLLLRLVRLSLAPPAADAAAPSASH